MPAALLTLYERRNSLNPGQLGRNDRELTEAIDLLHRLITGTDVKFAWAKLAQYTRVLSSPGATEYSIEVFYACLRSIQDWRRRPKYSAKTLPKIGRAALELMRLLENSVHFKDCPIDRFMSRRELAALGENANPFPELKFKEPLADDFKGRILLSNSAPNVPVVLDRIAAEARMIAKLPKAVRQSGSKRAEAHFVALELSRRFRRDLGKSLHGLVATITNAAVEGSELDADSVRKLTRDLDVRL